MKDRIVIEGQPGEYYLQWYLAEERVAAARLQSVDAAVYRTHGGELMPAESQLQSGCNCGGCDGYRAPEMWCGGARHHDICTTLQAAIARLHPKMGERYADCRDMFVLARAVGEAVNCAVQNIDYLQGKEPKQ